MTTIALKLNTRAVGGKVINNNLRQTIFQAMLFAFAGLSVCYVLLMGNMIFNIIARKALEIKVNTMSNNVGEMELQYLSMSNKIDLSFAKSVGFQETKMTFATRKSLGSLSIAKNEL